MTTSSTPLAPEHLLTGLQGGYDHAAGRHSVWLAHAREDQLRDVTVRLSGTLADGSAVEAATTWDRWPGYERMHLHFDAASSPLKSGSLSLTFRGADGQRYYVVVPFERFAEGKP